MDPSHFQARQQHLHALRMANTVPNSQPLHESHNPSNSMKFNNSFLGYSQGHISSLEAVSGVEFDLLLSAPSPHVNNLQGGQALACALAIFSQV